MRQVVEVATMPDPDGDAEQTLAWLLGAKRADLIEFLTRVDRTANDAKRKLATARRARMPGDGVWITKIEANVHRLARLRIRTQEQLSAVRDAEKTARVEQAEGWNRRFNEAAFAVLTPEQYASVLAEMDRFDREGTRRVPR